ncbi:benzoyl-CoA reductase [Frondihabitans sp. PAMC 28766]|uniref:acyl-CoA dehydratase activase n=1 Tax=Frondihabitans sp. PAMC 28766 TaxID=1795630 RepID=UPI00078BEB4F|nr:acyl-CoA dehydratase activase [Frondihabitans sp. PAMC 28766]AMM21867.1 benzoyl-CoA reductase [Frondihabitans sp. PAMC 28766]
MNWYVMGVDLGSTTAKVSIVDASGTMVGSKIVQMGAVSKEAVTVAMAAALDEAGITQDDIVRTISTGYGRKLVPTSDKTFTEITCHARGAAALFPGVRLVIDIGGQDSKAIAVDDDGLVDRFAMNDRCASGTGRFFDVLARALEVPVNEVGALALTGDSDLEVSSMCATFAETEVISLLAQGAERTDIAASVHKAVASRTLGLVAQVGKASPVVMTGGVAKNEALVAFLSDALRLPIEMLDEPQIAGAYGAAIIAREEHLGNLKAAESDVATERDLVAGLAVAAPHCQDCDGNLAGHSHGPVSLTLQTKRLVG